jgi:methionyl-tRNA formyltransferase
LLNGDTETGVTTFKLEKKVDTGNLYLQKKIEISGSDNFESLHDKLSILGSEAVIETVNLIAKNQYVLIKQNESESSPAPKISKEITQLNWNESVIKNFNKIRAFSPIPGAFFTNEGKIYKVYSSLLSNEIQIKQGEYFQNKSKLFVGCSDGTLEITEIQPEGKRVMKSEEFVRGYKLF